MRIDLGAIFASMICLWAMVVHGAPPLPQVPFDANRAQELQTEWARTLGTERVITNSLGMKLVLIPPGRFTLGPSGSTYRVTIRKAFYVATTEVTLGQYRRHKPNQRSSTPRRSSTPTIGRPPW